MSAERLQPVDLRSIYLRDLPFLPDLPLGKILLKISKLSSDSQTVNGMAQMKDELPHNSGLLLDAHWLKSGLDILISSAQAIDYLEPTEVFGPVAASFYNAERGLFPSVVRAIKANSGLKPIPVYRKEERGVAGREDTIQSDLSEEEMLKANSDYMIRIKEELIQPNRLGVIAPYGSRRTFGEKAKIRRGVIEILRTGVPALCAFTKFRARSGRYRVYTSGQVLRFSEVNSPEEIRSAVHEEFQRLSK